ncbi:hypothetical protein BCR37DRAFT_281254 [Protomyces lactucae-debilis]|uniref:Uncharacterized protein n=1 Tax=Protomyces lactucae-debilis TaxID=2754530 RepID=A0A1Y2FIQ0_PROLT|nr:uncharacterized protein BCR37DRAFT_281254 [Protomyces lactucae-debilis]ORY83818.1 hypothetical protein BCR37DRAFT_281254 [Protomyces lactucae-debilis]
MSVEIARKTISAHWLPHKRCQFEGYYSKFRLESGNHLALIVCSVHGAPQRAHMVSMTYVLSSANVAATARKLNIQEKEVQRSWQREVWAKENVYRASPSKTAFTIDVLAADSTAEPHGVVKYDEEGMHYDLHALPDTREGLSGFQLKCTSKPDTRDPYIQGDEQSTPAGVFANLPLPIQWHVQALSQDCMVSLSLETPEGRADPILDELDKEGMATMHQEKNWAASFPDGYLWVQSWSEKGKPGDGLCFAGGEAMLGIQAYLLTYRPSPEGLAAARSTRKDANKAFTFRPPFSMSVFGWSPFLSVKRKWISPSSNSTDPSTCILDVATFRQRLVVHAEAKKETFFTLSAPLPEGHRPRFCTQSFEATLKIEAYRRTLPWHAWTLVSSEERGDSSLEFGGDYFPEAGQQQW